jgi:hypothetical protein
MGYLLCLALGVLVSHWVLRPYIVSNSTHTDGFWVGVIAAILCLLFWCFVRSFFQVGESWDTWG